MTKIKFIRLSFSLNDFKVYANPPQMHRTDDRSLLSELVGKPMQDWCYFVNLEKLLDTKHSFHPNGCFIDLRAAQF